MKDKLLANTMLKLYHLIPRYISYRGIKALGSVLNHEGNFQQSRKATSDYRLVFAERYSRIAFNNHQSGSIHSKSR